MASSSLLLDSPVALEKRAARWWPFALYGLTGFSGVLAEQGFEKYIALLVGATAISSAIVIFAYFLGFALGGWAIARLLKAGRIRQPLRVYGLLELLVGASCIAFSFLFHPLVDHLAPLQSAAHNPALNLLVRFAFGAVLILPTAAMMGASFPVIAEALGSADDDNGKRWVHAYGWNLAGAAIAALGGAYFVLPALGVRGSFWVCLAIGTAVCVVAFYLPESEATRSRVQRGDVRREAVPGGWLLLSAAFLSGLVFFALEVVWTHLIATLLGSSVYAFSAMLGMVLIGLLIGSLRANRVSAAGSAMTFSRLLQFSALLLIVQFRLWDYSQVAFLVQLPQWFKSFYSIEAFKLALAAILIVPPAALLGTLYPVLLRNPALSREGTAWFAGYLNATNAIGCLVGALAGIFFFIPVVGSEWSLKSMAIILLLAGIGFLCYERPSRRVLIRAFIGAALVLGYACTWSWNRTLLTSGLNVYFGQTDKKPDKAAAPTPDYKAGIVFFEEHAQGGLTTVVELSSAGTVKHVLFSNGKYEGSDDLRDQGYAQLGFGVLPSQFVGGFQRSLLIGLGTGHCAHGLDRMGYQTVDIAEFAPGIVHAANTWFAHRNGRVLSDPNVRLYLEDGRNVLLTAAPASYDAITLEITSIWFAGATNLYSGEFYQLAKSRLRPGGALQQWIQLHHISPREIASAIATVRSEFQYVSVWFAGGQGMIIATDRPQVLTEDRRAYLESRLRMLEDVPESAQSELQAHMFNSQILNCASVDRLVAGSDPVINTDHNRWLEYATPRYNWTDKDWTTSNLEWLNSFTSR